MWLWQWPLLFIMDYCQPGAHNDSDGDGYMLWPLHEALDTYGREGATGNDSIRLPGLTRALTIWWGGIALTVPFILFFMVWKPVVW